MTVPVGRSQPLRSLLFSATFLLWTAVLLLVALPILALPSGASHALGRFWARATFAMLRWIVGIRYRIAGAGNRTAGAALYACKHQSTWETMALAILLDQPTYVLKRELTRIPLFGWFLARAEMISIDRGAGAAALRQVIAGAGRAIASGRPVVIFPEGTRTPIGTRQAYQPGIAALYERLDLPVIPVAVNSGLFWPRRGLGKRSGTITLEFLPAIAPGLPRRAFLAELEQRIEGATDRLVAEAWV